MCNVHESLEKKRINAACTLRNEDKIFCVLRESVSSSFNQVPPPNSLTKEISFSSFSQVFSDALAHFVTS